MDSILPNLSRRRILKSAGATTLGLVIGFRWDGPAADATPVANVAFAPNAFVRIAPDDSVTLISKHTEMGQGIYTGLATVLADELDADWSQIRIETAPVDVKLYLNSALGMQGTGGSLSLATSWQQLRKAGATARAMLVAAAAADWNVPGTELTVEKGTVHHVSSGR